MKSMKINTPRKFMVHMYEHVRVCVCARTCVCILCMCIVCAHVFLSYTHVYDKHFINCRV